MFSFPLLYLQEGPPLSLTLTLACFCGLFLLVIGVVVLGILVRRENAGILDEKKDKEL
jgi:hypothetical protein